jgi:hypothetical protein
MTGNQPPRRQDEPVASVPKAATCEALPAGEPGEPEGGGEPACWAHLVCPECGAMTSEGHRPGCESGPPAL